MKTIPPSPCSILIALTLLVQLNPAFAGGTVSTPTQAALQAAMAGGGTVTFACSGIITLTQTLNITLNTTIDANGYQVSLSGGKAVRLFAVTNASFQVNGLTLADGYVLGANGTNGLYYNPPGPGQDAAGACILNSGGTIVLTGCTLTNHSVLGGNPGTNSPYTSYTEPGGRGLGATICSVGGTINLTNCLITGSLATGGMGNLLVSGGFATGAGAAGAACGGAFYLANGIASFQAVTLTNSRAVGGATWVYQGNAVGTPGDALGGGLYIGSSSSLYLGNCVLTSNVAVGGAPMTYALSGGTGGGNAQGGALFLGPGCSAALESCLFLNDSADGGQPATHSAGGSGRGGAIWSGGSLQVHNSTLSGNDAIGSYGVDNGVPSRLGQGGAVYSTNSCWFSGCTLNNNVATGGAGSQFANWPAQVGQGGAVWSSGLLWATNSTWTTNQALDGPNIGTPPAAPASGGALFITNGSATLVNVTLAGNQADGSGPGQGGALMTTNGQVLVLNSIFAYSPTSSCSNIWGTVTDGGQNLSSDTTGGFTAPGSMVNTDPLLAPLLNNGGPTATCWLLPGSPARDKLFSGYPATDQRGAPRPQGPTADIGAVEADNPPPPAFTLLPSRSGNQLTLTLPADSWRAYRLLCSTDLVTWSDLATNSPMVTGTLQFTSPIAGPRAFYRVATP